MQIYSFIPLIGAISSFFLGVFVFYKNKKSPLNIVFSLWALSVAIWLFGTFWMFNSQTEEGIVWWDRFVYLGVVFIPIFMYHFGAIFTGISKIKKFLIYLGYFLALIFLIFSRTDYFIKDVFRYSWGVHTKAQFLHHIFLLWLLFYILLFFIQVFRFHRKSSGQKRTQAQYVFLAFTILFIGALEFLPAYSIPIHPITYLAEAIAIIILAYTITRYRLMDIRVVIRKGVVYTLLVIIIFGIFSFLILFLGSYFQNIFNLNFILITALLALVISSLLIPLKKLIEKWINQIFFPSKYDFQERVRYFKQVIDAEINLEKLLQNIVTGLVSTLKMEDIYFLLEERNTRDFQTEFTTSTEKITLRRKETLTLRLKERKEILVYEELPRLITEEETQAEIEDLKEIKERMKGLGIALVAPVISDRELIGIILLGPKLSRDSFTEEDIRLIYSITEQAGEILRNALLYQDAMARIRKIKEEGG